MIPSLARCCLVADQSGQSERAEVARFGVSRRTGRTNPASLLCRKQINIVLSQTITRIGPPAQHLQRVRPVSEGDNINDWQPFVSFVPFDSFHR
jgi:hypothetical protein